MPITRFQSANGDTYTFPTEAGNQEYNDNFKEVVLNTTRLPGADGGFDEHGQSRAPGAVGKVQFGFYLVTESRSAMLAKRDQLGAMREWGPGLLYYRPPGDDGQPDTGQPERWCFARVNNILLSEKRHEHTDLFQKVQITFQASDPFWYAPGTEEVWGSFNWNDGSLWSGSSGTLVTGSGDLTLANSGNAFTLARIVIVNGGSISSNFRFRRMVNGLAADDFFMGVSIASNAVLEADARRHRIYQNYIRLTDAQLSGLVTAKHPDWLRLMPGVNTVRVTLDGAATVFVRYLERYT